MAAKKKTFWLGELVGSRRVGVIGIEGKLYGIGEEIPADKIDSDKLKALKKSGAIGTAPFQHSGGSSSGDAKDKDIELLKERVSALEKEKDELGKAAVADGDRIAELELDIEALEESDLAKKVKELESEIDKLSSEKDGLAKEVEKKDKTIEKLDKKVKKLEDGAK
jgi:chromosome segregation ATPase